MTLCCVVVDQYGAGPAGRLIDRFRQVTMECYGAVLRWGTDKDLVIVMEGLREYANICFCEIGK